MSEILQKAAEAITQRLPNSPLPARVRFEVTGEGSLLAGPDGVTFNTETQADITIRANAEIFRALLKGETSAASAFMKGKITVEGDFPTAMRLAGLLSR